MRYENGKSFIINNFMGEPGSGTLENASKPSVDINPTGKDFQSMYPTSPTISKVGEDGLRKTDEQFSADMANKDAEHTGRWNLAFGEKPSQYGPDWKGERTPFPWEKPEDVNKAVMPPAEAPNVNKDKSILEKLTHDNLVNGVPFGKKVEDGQGSVLPPKETPTPAEKGAEISLQAKFEASQNEMRILRGENDALRGRISKLEEMLYQKPGGGAKLETPIPSPTVKAEGQVGLEEALKSKDATINDLKEQVKKLNSQLEDFKKASSPTLEDQFPGDLELGDKLVKDGKEEEKVDLGKPVEILSPTQKELDKFSIDELKTAVARKEKAEASSSEREKLKQEIEKTVMQKVLGAIAQVLGIENFDSSKPLGDILKDFVNKIREKAGLPPSAPISEIDKLKAQEAEEAKIGETGELPKSDVDEILNRKPDADSAPKPAEGSKPTLAKEEESKPKKTLAEIDAEVAAKIAEMNKARKDKGKKELSGFKAYDLEYELKKGKYLEALDYKMNDKYIDDIIYGWVKIGILDNKTGEKIKGDDGKEFKANGYDESNAGKTKLWNSGRPVNEIQLISFLRSRFGEKPADQGKPVTPEKLPVTPASPAKPEAPKGPGKPPTPPAGPAAPEVENPEIKSIKDSLNKEFIDGLIGPRGEKIVSDKDRYNEMKVDKTYLYEKERNFYLGKLKYYLDYKEQPGLWPGGPYKVEIRKSTGEHINDSKPVPEGMMPKPLTFETHTSHPEKYPELLTYLKKEAAKAELAKRPAKTA